MDPGFQHINLLEKGIILSELVKQVWSQLGELVIDLGGAS
jgi:hypothetical protein